MSEPHDPRMAMTLRDVEKYLIIPRSRALVVWKFPVLYPGAQQQCSPSD